MKIHPPAPKQGFLGCVGKSSNLHNKLLAPQVSDAANVTYPPLYERFLAIVSIFNLDLVSFLGWACVVATDFYDTLLVSTLAPIAVLAVLACTYTVAKWRNGCKASGSFTPGRDEGAVILKKHASVALLVAFLVYGGVTRTLFGMFDCDHLDGMGSYLRGDYSICCDTDQHRLFQWYAAVMIFLYPVGIPVLFAVLLLSNRDALRNTSGGRADNPTIMIFADLWEPYRPEMYLFELVEYLRRILLSGIVVFIFPNTAAQIAVTFVMEFFFFVVSIVLLPYKKRCATRLVGLYVARIRCVQSQISGIEPHSRQPGGPVQWFQLLTTTRPASRQPSNKSGSRPVRRTNNRTGLPCNLGNLRVCTNDTISSARGVSTLNLKTRLSPRSHVLCSRK